MRTSPRARRNRTPDPDLELALLRDELEPHWIPMFNPHRTLVDNVFSIARPLWGKPRAEWTMWLAHDLVTELPEAAAAGTREWAAAILWAAALDARMDRDERLWAHIVEDITASTGVAADRAQERFDELRELGLARPRNEPSWWYDDEDD